MVALLHLCNTSMLWSDFILLWSYLQTYLCVQLRKNKHFALQFCCSFSITFVDFLWNFCWKSTRRILLQSFDELFLPNEQSMQENLLCKKKKIVNGCSIMHTLFRKTTSDAQKIFCYSNQLLSEYRRRRHYREREIIVVICPVQHSAAVMFSCPSGIME